MNKDDVLILLGSANDEPYLEKCTTILKKFEVGHQVRVASAHRSPDRVIRLLKEFDGKAKVIIAFAGHAAHLAGVIAAHSHVPVVAVPLPTSDFQGLDSLLASVQMPGGIPVAVMAVGHSGSQNAGVFATQVLALNDPALDDRLRAYKQGLADKVEKSSQKFEN